MSGKSECPNICEGTIVIMCPFLPLFLFLMAKMGRRGEALDSPVPAALNKYGNKYVQIFVDTVGNISTVYFIQTRN